MDWENREHSTNTQEFKETIQAFVGHEMFDMFVTRLFPNTSKEELKRRLLEMECIEEFQSVFMYRACQWVIEKTMTSFTYSGTEYLDERPRLFISNHRDIVLDAMMLQYILVGQGLPTTHVVIGANLFEIPTMPLLARLNKMYSIGRGGNGREYYRGLMEMSQQLRQWVEQGESAWIAQRNGRTKDGIDHTESSLVKMIAKSGNEDNPIEALAAMNITPVSVSYEWEPCATWKAREMCLSQQGSYTKAPGEDMQSVMSGIKDFKGRVHFSIGKPISFEELAEIHTPAIRPPLSRGNGGNLTKEEKALYEEAAGLIDRRIAEGYRLWENNRIAKQMLKGERVEESTESRAFEAYVEEACRQFPLGEEFRRRLLGIYAGGNVEDIPPA
jgi:1-acyl-sn-glycerol-3-phosphate acyltransferase